MSPSPRAFSPGVLATLSTAVLTIALGVGASTTIFSVTNAVLLKPLPYRDPDKLVIAGMDLRKRDVHDLPFSNADYIDLRDGTKAYFSDMAGIFTGRMVVPQEDGSPEQISYRRRHHQLLRCAGRQNHLWPRLQRAGWDSPAATARPTPRLTDAPAPLPGIAILSYEYFRRRYGANPAIIGHNIDIPGQPGPLIVGVLAPGFRLYFPPDADVEPAPDIYIANRLGYDSAERKNFSIRPIGRLKEGASLQSAQGAADGIAAQARQTFPSTRPPATTFISRPCASISSKPCAPPFSPSWPR